MYQTSWGWPWPWYNCKKITRLTYWMWVLLQRKGWRESTWNLTVSFIWKKFEPLRSCLIRQIFCFISPLMQHYSFFPTKYILLPLEAEASIYLLIACCLSLRIFIFSICSQSSKFSLWELVPLTLQWNQLLVWVSVCNIIVVQCWCSNGTLLQASSRP